MKILMIEDNAMNRDMLARRLKRLGYDVVVAQDGESGIAMAQGESPGLIIMDLSLPGVDGWEATRLLRSMPQTRSIPILALTAHAVNSDRIKAIAIGCDDYDTKPVDIDRLSGKIARLIGPDRVPAPIPIVPTAAPVPSEAIDLWSSSQVVDTLSPPEVKAGSPAVPQPAASGSAVTILLVEDNELNRDMLSRRLQRVGYTLLLAVDGEEGIAMARSATPHLILMDMSLPALDGWEATRMLKAAPEARSIPIIALTAHAMTSDYEKCMAAGCDDYDTKPVEFKRLLGKIEAQLVRAGIQPPRKP